MSRIAVVGAGAVGRTLGRLLARAGHEIGPVVCRTDARAREAVAFIGSGSPRTDPAVDAEIVLLAVPDDAIAATAARLHTRGHVIHLCGNLPAEIVRPSGGVAGAIHPLRSFADPAAAVEAFAGTFCFYEGDDPAALRALIESIGGRAVAVSAEAKPLYHAGAVFASNYVVALFDMALRLFAEAGVPRETAQEALAGLTLGTAENLRRVGVPAALTGPIARGEVGTVRAHLARLDPESAALYRALGRATLAVARGFSDKTATELEALLR